MGANDKSKTSGKETKWRGNRSLVIGVILVVIAIAVYVWWSGASSTQSRPEPASKWKTFISVEGQPEPVPAEWVATPEGRLAHSIKLPEPLPADSGYREEMTSKEYWEHLCKTEAGEFIYKTADNVEGFYFMRPPGRPSDDELKDSYQLEAPDIERTYQLLQATPVARSKTYVSPPWSMYRYVEEPNTEIGEADSYVRMSGYSVHNKSPMQVTEVSELSGRYGMTWRGIRRAHDRELAIAGSEWIVIDLKTNEVFAVQRNFAFSGWVKRTPEGIWWLNASTCPTVPSRNLDTTAFYKFVSKALRPVAIEETK